MGIEHLFFKKIELKSAKVRVTVQFYNKSIELRRQWKMTLNLISSRPSVI